MSAPCYSWGPRSDGEQTRFRLWAPARAEVTLEIDGATAVPMMAVGEDWHQAVARAPAGTRYRFRVGGIAVPDPAARIQSVDGFSVVADTGTYCWRHSGWQGRPWTETVLYEAHAGLLGGFEGVRAMLPSLAALGITAVELMPVADFPGARNWGYDGVLPYAPDATYGTPDDLRRLIDDAHGMGMTMFLDVVYNHFGPDGNYLPLYAPGFFRSDRPTPWGDAIDFRREPVQRFFIENALYWIHEFRFDGLRFDAVHAIEDVPFLKTMAREIRGTVPAERHVHLVIENENNDASLLESAFDAQWNDDFHHALHVMLTGESAGYYADYADAPVERLARALREGFGYQGERSVHCGRARGTPSRHLPPAAFVSFLQNHDHTGNRAFGERLLSLADPERVKAAAALLLLAPQIPLVFMGEEAGAREPFLYFCDHRDAKLAQAVRIGRRAEFAKFPEFADERRRNAIPDPNASETFERSRPRFDGPAAREWHDLYSALLQLRHRHIVPRLNGARAERAEPLGARAVIAAWRMGDGARLTLAFNSGDEPVAASVPKAPPIWGAEGTSVPARATTAWIEAP